jgi:Na+-driven multidrug efflux pump
MPLLASMIVFTNALRGAGDTRVPVLFTLVGFFVVRIPLAYFLALGELGSLDLFSWELGPFVGLDMGLYGCWLAMCADIVTRGAFFLFRFVHGAWKLQRV